MNFSWMQNSYSSNIRQPRNGAQFAYAKTAGNGQNKAMSPPTLSIGNDIPLDTRART
jgi:hypothetical protein